MKDTAHIVLTDENSGQPTFLNPFKRLAGVRRGGKGRLFCLVSLLVSFALCQPDKAGATTLVNGGYVDASLPVNTSVPFNLTANTGDTIVLRGHTAGLNLDILIRLFDPNGVEVAHTGGDDHDRELQYTTVTNGTFVATVSSAFSGFSGTFRLYYGKIPGAFVVPAGDEGGGMTSGGNYDGTIDLADFDLYSFTGKAGDAILLRIGTTNFDAKMELYAPDGTDISDTGGSDVDRELTNVLTATGTYTVRVSSYNYDDSGTYRLHFVKTAGDFIVPAGDEGGSLTNGFTHAGTIDLGDIDLWSFTALKGNPIVLKSTSTFNLSLHIYGPDGVEVTGALGNIHGWTNNYTASNSGKYTVLVQDYGGDQTGTYQLTLTGAAGDLKLLQPMVSGTNLSLTAQGGLNGVYCILQTTTNITPPVSWAPLLTNQFNSSGLAFYTNYFDINERQRFFRLYVP